MFLEDEPRHDYFPPVEYYPGRVAGGLGSRGAAHAYSAFLVIKAKSEKDAMLRDARTRLNQ